MSAFPTFDTADLMVTLPTPVTDALDTFLQTDQMMDEPYGKHMADLARSLERDAMTFALRLFAEDPDSFSPETREAMARWKPRVEALLSGEFAS